MRLFWTMHRARWLSSGRLVACVALVLAGCRTMPPAGPSLAEFAPGLAYTNICQPEVPWSIHLVRLDRQRSDLEFQTAHAFGSSIGVNTLSEQIESLRFASREPLAAVNGDFFQVNGRWYAGDPRGLQIADGELVSAPNGGAVFWIDATGQPRIAEVTSRFTATWPNGKKLAFGLNEGCPKAGAVLYTPKLGAASTGTTNGWEFLLEPDGPKTWRPLTVGTEIQAQVREVQTKADSLLEAEGMVLSIGSRLTKSYSSMSTGAVVRLALATKPDLTGVSVAVGGGPILLHRGWTETWRKTEVRRRVWTAEFSTMKERHPRAALGWNDRYFYLVLVDGRQKGVSVGMTLKELALYLRNELGCVEAMNLDGGGSATLWCDGQVRNSPSDGEEREIANSLVVVRKGKARGLETQAGARSANSAE